MRAPHPQPAKPLGNMSVPMVATVVASVLMGAAALLWGTMGDSFLGPGFVLGLSCMMLFNGLWTITQPDEQA